MIPGNQKRFSLTFGGLFHEESVWIAELLNNGVSLSNAKVRAAEDGIFSFPRRSSQMRGSMEVGMRLTYLADDELDFLVHTDRATDARALLWIACCRAYVLLREFTEEVTVPVSQRSNAVLEPLVFDEFIRLKSDWCVELSALSTSTKNKIRQVSFKIMREVGFLTKNNHIQPLHISDELKQIIVRRQKGELELVPGALC